MVPVILNPAEVDGIVVVVGGDVTLCSDVAFCIDVTVSCRSVMMVVVTSVVVELAAMTTGLSDLFVLVPSHLELKQK